MISTFKVSCYKHYMPSHFTTINILSYTNNKWIYINLIDHLDL
jgi:hypothetical protein